MWDQVRFGEGTVPTAVAYQLDATATGQPQPFRPLVAILPQPGLDAQTQLVHDLVALTDFPYADPVTVQVLRRGPQLEVTLRRAGLALELPRVEPVARAHRVAVASAYAAAGVVRLSLLLPALGFGA
jgi:hypothetical protein